MGFYGNITNVAGTQFQFDRIYPNRWTMESKKVEDGIYAGRFVLIEYDSSVDDFDYFRAYSNSSRTLFYSDPEGKIQIKYSHSETKNDHVTLNTIVRIRDLYSYQDTYEFFRCVGSETGADGGPAMFERVSESHTSSYISNFNIDYVSYGNQATSWRGYDSTVWQKVYTDEGEKYVMVAELNSVVPTFMMSTYSDAPTETPVAPHFDTMSSSTMYYMHAQPQWGFRIAEAKAANQSDEVTTWHPVSALGKPTGEQTVDAAIYYNKAGFDSKIVSKNTNVQDKINIVPSGMSGQYYNTHDSEKRTTGAKKQIDTQELTINLPSIGNAVSDLWDILYGGTAVNGSANRNRDIQWDSTYGLRLVNRNADGYTFTPENVATVAGCINSVHDLMGMIIETDTADALTADPDKIYYRDNSFYIKWPEYQWNFLNPNGEIIELDEQYLEIDLIQYVKDTYFYKKGNDYLVSTDEEFIEGQTYYELGKKDNKTFTVSYYPDVFYSKINSSTNINYSDYVLITSAKFNNEIEHYRIVATERTNTTNRFIYKPGVYYYQSEGAETPDEGDDRYLVANENVINSEISQYYKAVENGFEVIEQDGVLVTRPTYEMVPVTLIGYQDKTFYSYDAILEKYVAVTSNDEISQEVIYYTLDVTKQPSIMYENNMYYYEDDNGNHILDTNSAHTDGREYFQNDFLKSDIIFYKAGKYYYVNNNGIKVIDNGANMTVGRTYYEKTDVYVYEDVNGIFVPGAVWNVNVDVIEGVKLATRKTTWGWRELEGFARNLNTIHGLIVELNNRLMSDDTWTRQLDTAQGAINIMNDLIEKISELKPKDVVIVDEYGHMHSAQTLDDDWIAITVDDSYLNPSFTVEHTYNPISDTASSTNLNTPEVSTIDLYTPKVDAMGHVVGKNTETVTLPYGFKRIDVSAKSSETGNVMSAAGILEADTPFDTTVFAPGNKWINLTSDVNNDKIIFSHEVNLISTTAKADTDMEAISEFTVQDLLFDEAGHMTANQAHKYKLPNNFKTIAIYANTDTGAPINVSADNTADTLTMIPGDTWIELSADANNDKISFYHKKANAATTTVGQAATASPQFGETFKVLNLGYDDKGHINSSEAYNITLPQVTIANGTGNVVTGLSINSTTGVITESKNNIANLALTDYVVPAEVYANIAATDTLASAFSKIEKTLYNFNLRFNVIDLNISALKSKDEEFAQNFTNLDMQLELMQMKDTNFDGRISTLENIINDIENEDGSITTGLSSQVARLNTLMFTSIDENENGRFGIQTLVSNLSTDIYGTKDQLGLIDQFNTLTDTVAYLEEQAYTDTTVYTLTHQDDAEAPIIQGTLQDILNAIYTELPGIYAWLEEVPTKEDESGTSTPIA